MVTLKQAPRIDMEEHKHQHEQTTAPGYAAELLDLLYHAIETGFEVSVEGGNFIANRWCENWDDWDRHVVPFKYSFDAYNQFTDFKYAVGQAIHEKQERDRLEAVRQSAMQKLTVEEQRALGLIGKRGE